jgi:hypothetical protein
MLRHRVTFIIYETICSNYTQLLYDYLYAIA